MTPVRPAAMGGLGAALAVAQPSPVGWGTASGVVQDLASARVFGRATAPWVSR
jgi:hypothetical protein